MILNLAWILSIPSEDRKIVHEGLSNERDGRVFVVGENGPDAVVPTGI